MKLCDYVIILPLIAIAFMLGFMTAQVSVTYKANRQFERMRDSAVFWEARAAEWKCLYVDKLKEEGGAK